MYKIYFCYTTGSTFETYDTEGSFELVFAKLEDAKAALQRMKEHNEWRDSINSHWRSDGEQPEWWKPRPGRFKDSFCWYFPVIVDGKEEWLDASEYQGFFETLHSAEIKHVTPDESGIRFNTW